MALSSGRNSLEVLVKKLGKEGTDCRLWAHLKYFIVDSSWCIGPNHWTKWTWHVGLDELDVEK
jgi:hypothetical protein